MSNSPQTSQFVNLTIVYNISIVILLIIDKKECGFMEFFIVDAFTDEAFGGNTAGVVIYEELEGETMQKIAAELRYSETAFVKKISINRFSIRFFTPNSEVDLCGHASVASFKVLLYKRMAEKNKTYLMETRAGSLQVNITDEQIYLEAGTPVEGKLLKEEGIKEALASILNISFEDMGDYQVAIEPQIIATGLYDIIVPVKSKAALEGIDPDFNRLAELSEEFKVVGVHAFTLDTKGYTALCRNFAPLYGINEEAATGTANAALTYYLYLNNILREKNKDFIFRQGESMHRPSLINTRIVGEDKVKIFVGGRAYILASGELFL
jgi:PhzF family phenazine biosynthesis protein